MNWEAIGAVGEVGGAIAVVATLIYLAAQIRQNTSALASNVAQAVTNTSLEITLRLQENAELWAAWTKVVEGEESLSADERLRVGTLMRALFRTFENHFYQNQQGFLTDLWPGYLTNMRDFFSSPFVRGWWPEHENRYGPAFREFVNTEIDHLEPSSSPMAINR